MKTLQRWGNFILTSQLFIALCAVSFSIESSITLETKFKEPSFYFFIFFSTLAVYNLYYFSSRFFPYAKIICAIATPAALFFSFTIAAEDYYILGFISLLGLAYLLPAKWWFLWSKYFHVQKLLILIIIWVTCTFVLPLNPVSINNTYLIYFLYRLVLMSQICLMFLIKDETNIALKNYSIIASKILAFAQVLISILIFNFYDTWIGFVFIFISIILLILSRQFNKKNPSNSHYLFFVDGIMLLQSIFVILKLIAFHEL